jgi:hypothetical protein
MAERAQVVEEPDEDMTWKPSGPSCHWSFETADRSRPTEHHQRRGAAGPKDRVVRPHREPAFGNPSLRQISAKKG